MPESQLGLQKIPNPEDNSLATPGYGRSSVPYGYNATSDQTFQIRDVWHTVRKRIWLVLSIGLIVTVVVTIEMFRAKTLYKSSATVEVGRENAARMKSGDLIIQGDDASTVKTSILLIQSRPTLEEVTVGLELDKKPEFFAADAKKSLWEAILTITNKAISLGTPTSYPTTIQPTSVSSASKDRTQEESRRLTPYVNYLRRIQTIEPVPDTRVLTISYTHADPVLAAALAQGTAQIFIQRGYQRQTQKFTSASDWLERTTGDLKLRVEQAEKALSEYSRQHNIVNPGEGKGTFTSDKLASLHTQAMKAETDRILKESLYQEVVKGNAAQIPEAFADPKTEELKVKRNDLLTSVAQLSVKYGPENPKVVEVREQLRAIEQQIQDTQEILTRRIKADYERAVRDEKTLKDALARTKSETADESLSNIQFDLLRQDVQTTKSLYTDFLQKTNQANLQVAEQENGYRIIEPAELGIAVGPNRVRVILISLFLSLGAGVGLTFFIEYLDNTIKSIDDVSKYVQLPTLSIIPAFSTTNPRLLGVKKKGNSTALISNAQGSKFIGADSFELDDNAAEAYRVLRTSVLLSTAGNPPKTILITSGQPGEGKTTTVCNRAISLCQLGLKVLLIDADLRRPKLHKTLGVKNTKGLSSYLSRDGNLTDLIQTLSIPNLSLMPSGPVPPNPAELLSSDKMRLMLKDLAEQYDHIIVDSAPLANLTDSVVLSTMVDGVIVVVHGGKTRREVVRRVHVELATVGAKIFGVVLNNLDLKRSGYYDYYYYRYNYGYQTKTEIKDKDESNGSSDYI